MAHSLFVWSEESIWELKKKSGNLKQLQLNAIFGSSATILLWLVASMFKVFGLRVNRLKRKRGEV